MTEHKAPPRYAIITDTDAPQPNMVAQWVPGVGYCYLDRTNGKPRHDGMRSDEATSVEAFGWSWLEPSASLVQFVLTDRPVTATYRDGEPRRWQHRSEFFEYRQIKVADVQAKAPEDD